LVFPVELKPVLDHELPKPVTGREFSALRKKFWGLMMVARGFSACSTGNGIDEMFKASIESHKETDDRFGISDGDLQSLVQLSWAGRLAPGFGQ
jgi:hypothetical protein